MAYKAYITEALVCGSEDRHTSDRSYLLFTREAGMLYATARSVREERSKQRYALQEFSYTRLTLVRGKGGWRIAGAEAVENVYMRAEVREARAFIMRIIALLRRTVRGETPHTQIFDDVRTAFREYHTHDLALLEDVLSLRILNNLGYIPPDAAYNRLLLSESCIATTAVTEAEIGVIRKAIERALVESQL